MRERGFSSGVDGFLDGASRATMVLLPKQVHLQKDVGEAAKDIERKERKVMRRKMKYGGRRIVAEQRRITTV